MQELFRGYLPTKNKAPLVKFKDAKPLSEVKDLPEYAGLLANNVVLIDVDDYEASERLMTIVEDLQINCRVAATKRGKHFFFYGGNIDKCGTHLKLAIGIEADIKIGDHNSISILKADGKERTILYDIEPHESYEPVPEWLRPVNSKVDFMSLESGDGRNQTLFNYILTLQAAEISNEDIKTTITLLNKYILSEPLEEAELNKILREESFQKPNFYDKNNKFQVDRFSRYLRDNHHVIKINGQLHIYRDGIYCENRESVEAKMIELIPGMRRSDRSEVTDYIKLITPDTASFSDAHYIAFKNGIYNLHTGKLEDFNPEIIVRNKIPWNYNYEAYNEALDGVLDRVSCNDDSVRDLLEEMAGYCLYRRNELRKAFILIGDKANGKSTFLDCIAYMVGDVNISALDLKDVGDRFKTAELFGKLVNIGDDIGDEFIANPAMFKKLVSGDRVTVERKGLDPFEFNNYSKFLFSANNIPRIKDKTGAVLDRLVIVPFNATFSKTDPDYDPYIKYKLRSAEAMEYLIQVGLEGLKRVLDNNGFTICQKVQNEINEYHEQNNPIIGFFKDLDLDIDVLNQPTKEVYTRYKLYCNENGFTPLSANEFSKYVKKELGLDIGVAKVGGKSCRIFREVSG